MGLNVVTHHLDLVAHLLVGVPQIELKLLYGCFVLSLLPHPGLMLLLDCCGVLFLYFGQILRVAGLEVVLIVESVLVYVLNGLLQVLDFLQILLFILFLTVLEVVIFILE